MKAAAEIQMLDQEREILIYLAEENNKINSQEIESSTRVEAQHRISVVLS